MIFILIQLVLSQFFSVSGEWNRPKREPAFYANSERKGFPKCNVFIFNYPNREFWKQGTLQNEPQVGFFPFRRESDNRDDIPTYLFSGDVCLKGLKARGRSQEISANIGKRSENIKLGKP